MVTNESTVISWTLFFFKNWQLPEEVSTFVMFFWNCEKNTQTVNITPGHITNKLKGFS